MPAGARAGVPHVFGARSYLVRSYLVRSYLAHAWERSARVEKERARFRS